MKGFFLFITKTIKINGLVIIFGKDGVYQETTSLAISEVLNIESKFSVDIDNDGNFGDKVDVFLANDNTNSGI